MGNGMSPYLPSRSGSPPCPRGRTWLQVNVLSGPRVLSARSPFQKLSYEKGPQMIGIKDIGTRQLETRDLGDSLQFVLKRNPRWGNVVAELIVIGGVSFVAWWRHSVMILVFAVVGIIGLVSNRTPGV